MLLEYNDVDGAWAHRGVGIGVEHLLRLRAVLSRVLPDPTRDRWKGWDQGAAVRRRSRPPACLAPICSARCHNEVITHRVLTG